MVFSTKNKIEINLGVIEEEYATSINDKLARKNYLNEFSVLLMATVTTMSRLPTMVGVQKSNKYSKKGFLSFEFCMRSRRTKLLGSIQSAQELTSYIRSSLPLKQWGEFLMWYKFHLLLMHSIIRMRMSICVQNIKDIVINTLNKEQFPVLNEIIHDKRSEKYRLVQ